MGSKGLDSHEEGELELKHKEFVRVRLPEYSTPCKEVNCFSSSRTPGKQEALRD
jgi:hypothetical protein